MEIITAVSKFHTTGVDPCRSTARRVRPHERGDDRLLRRVFPHTRKPKTERFQNWGQSPSKRWQVERSFAWLDNFGQLVARYDRSLMICCAFFHIGLLHDRLTLNGFFLEPLYFADATVANPSAWITASCSAGRAF